MTEVLRPGLERLSVKLQVINRLNKRVPKRKRIETAVPLARRIRGKSRVPG
jgi:hypothetical protein